jgi:hypothetical protein
MLKIVPMEIISNCHLLSILVKDYALHFSPGA